MKVTISARLHTHRSEAGASEEADIEIVGHPDDGLGSGQIRLVHPEVSLEFSASDLERALRVFRKER